jgi:hypothetical protein
MDSDVPINIVMMQLRAMFWASKLAFFSVKLPFFLLNITSFSCLICMLPEIVLGLS